MKYLSYIVMLLFIFKAVCAEDTPRIPTPIDSFTVELTIPGQEAPVVMEGKIDNLNRDRVQRKMATGLENTELNGPALNHMLTVAFDFVEKPGPKLTVRFAEKAGATPTEKAQSSTFTAYPKGLREAVYALKLMLLPKDFETWAKTNVKPPNDAVPIVALKSIWDKDHPDGMKDRVEVKPEAAEAVVKAARTVYGQRRAELIAKFSQSFLFYRAADQCQWTVTEKGKTRWANTGISDLMFAAQFIFQMEAQPDGSWKCVNIFGAESFKGE